MIKKTVQLFYFVYYAVFLLTVTHCRIRTHSNSKGSLHPDYKKTYLHLTSNGT